MKHGGLLAEILDRLAGFLEASARLRKKVKSAMTYPVIVICIAFAITTFLIVKVVPIFGEIFKDFGAKLPAPTQFLIDVSDFMRGEMVFLDPRHRRHDSSALRAFLRSDPRQAIERPMEAEAADLRAAHSQDLHVAFSRTFAQLIRSGVPILEVLDIVGGASGNHVVETEHQRRQRGRGERRQSFRRAFQETDFPADDAANGRGG